MRSCLRIVAERFPGVHERAISLFDHDEAFQELCEEYEACVKAEDTFDPASGANRALRMEYAALRLRLEGELLRHLREGQQHD
jgi:hypothetical protein